MQPPQNKYNFAVIAAPKGLNGRPNSTNTNTLIPVENVECSPNCKPLTMIKSKIISKLKEDETFNVKSIIYAYVKFPATEYDEEFVLEFENDIDFLRRIEMLPKAPQQSRWAGYIKMGVWFKTKPQKRKKKNTENNNNNILRRRGNDNNIINNVQNILHNNIHNNGVHNEIENKENPQPRPNKKRKLTNYLSIKYNPNYNINPIKTINQQQSKRRKMNETHSNHTHSSKSSLSSDLQILNTNHHNHHNHNHTHNRPNTQKYKPQRSPNAKPKTGYNLYSNGQIPVNSYESSIPFRAEKNRSKVHKRNNNVFNDTNDNMSLRTFRSRMSRKSRDSHLSSRVSRRSKSPTSPIHKSNSPISSKMTEAHDRLALLNVNSKQSQSQSHNNSHSDRISQRHALKAITKKYSSLGCVFMCARAKRAKLCVEEWQKRKEEELKRKEAERLQQEMDAKEEQNDVLLRDLKFKDFEDSDHALIEEIFNLPPHQTVGEHKQSNIEVTVKDLATLEEGQWLNVEVLNFYMALLQDRNLKRIKQDSNNISALFMNTFFFTKLCSNSYNYKAVKRWTKKAKFAKKGLSNLNNIFELDKFVFPVHVNNIHWCCGCINFKEKKFEYYDSMNGRSAKFFRMIRLYLMDEWKDKLKSDVAKYELNLDEWVDDNNCNKYPQQENGVDCGVFTSKCADWISDDLYPDYSQQDMSYFRERMMIEIISGKTLDF